MVAVAWVTVRGAGARELAVGERVRAARVPETVAASMVAGERGRVVQRAVGTWEAAATETEATAVDWRVEKLEVAETEVAVEVMVALVMAVTEVK